MKGNHVAAILEDISGQMQRMAEVLSTLATKEQLQRVEEDASELKTDVKTIKAVVTSQRTQLEDHEVRITTLETAQQKVQY